MIEKALNSNPFEEEDVTRNKEKESKTVMCKTVIYLAASPGKGEDEKYICSSPIACIWVRKAMVVMVAPFKSLYLCINTTMLREETDYIS